MSIGEQIIAAIHRGRMAKVIDNTENAYVEHFTLQFHKGASEQLEAVVEAHIQEEVRKRVYIEMSLKKNLDAVADSVTDKDRRMIQDYIDKKYPDVAPPYPDSPTD